MPEDDARNGLRVGGWIPPYSPGGNPAGPIRPTAHPHANAPHYRDSFPRLRGEGTMRPRLVLAAALCLACAATAAIAVILDASRKPEPVAAEFEYPALPGQALPGFPPALGSADVGDVPVSVQPSPTDTTVPPTHTRRYSPPPATSPVATRTTTKPPTTTKPTTAAPVRLNVGSTVGLAAADRPGERVRHRNYRGRLDTISASSSAGERADAAFRVRTGLGDDDCVSLESVNFPGYYLRHRNFEIRLDRNDGSALFRQDATFCPVTIRQGAALALRSTNYPRHYVVADDDWLKIVETTAARATAFTPRSAL
ncbi:AbfB domain-containing protein [Actinoplanes sp. NPDC026670]|uniref:AbfB domain-containing protein n=1 Tax=Actinoplanes sp. NPDC026670 TaxID=3154700 RepID=UPI0033DC8993